ncbi:MAG: transcriptional regulator, partial [Staphylococcus sp.]|nr:transcriptional regulator [Staphylococcus sp.]
MHEDTNVNCVVGANIQSVLEIILLRAQDAMEGVLANVTMDDIVTDILQRNG